jgi:hypothetical protein
MRNGEEPAKLAFAVQHGDDDGVEEKQVQRALRQNPKPEKNPGHRPGKPARLPLPPPA